MDCNPTAPIIPYTLAPSLQIGQVRKVEREFDLTTAFDRFTVFRISYLPYVFFDVIWDYIESLMDLTCILRISETKRLNRALKEIRADYDRMRAKCLDCEHRQNIADHAQQYIDDSTALKWAYTVIHSEYKRKFPDMKTDWVMLVAQTQTLMAMFAALKKYAAHFDKLVTAKAGRVMHSILPDDVKRMQILVPEYMGDIPAVRIRPLVEAALLKDLFNQEFTDEL